MKPLAKIGLTGGIAAGKSTLAALWRQQGATIFEADEFAHAALRPGTATYVAIVRIFGTAILNADQTINRAALGEIVFNDERQRQVLNGIVHPVVRRSWTAAVQALAAAGAGGVAVVSIPLLYEVGAQTAFDRVIAIGCSVATQQARLAAKRLTPAQIAARIRAQWPMQKKMDLADFVIWNDGSLANLREQAGIIWAIIKENSHATSKNQQN